MTEYSKTIVVGADINKAKQEMKTYAFTDRGPQSTDYSYKLIFDMSNRQGYGEKATAEAIVSLLNIPISEAENSKRKLYPTLSTVEIKLPGDIVKFTTLFTKDLCFLRKADYPYDYIKCLKFTSATLQSIDRWSAPPPNKDTFGYVTIKEVDLTGLTSLKAIHHLTSGLWNMEWGEYREGYGMAYFYTLPQSVEDVSDLFSKSPVSTHTVTDLVSQNLSNVKTMSRFLYQATLNSTYLDEPQNIWKLYFYLPRVFDFSKWKKLENLEEAFAETAIRETGGESSYEWPYQLVGLGIKAPITNVRRMFAPVGSPAPYYVKNFTVKDLSISNIQIPQSSVNGDMGSICMYSATDNNRPFYSLSSCKGCKLTVTRNSETPDFGPNILVVGQNSDTVNIVTEKYYVETGNTAKNNQIAAAHSNATIGIPAGWAHIYKEM